MPNPTANPQFLPPNLAEFMSRRMRDVAANMHCCLIGKIDQVNNNQTVTVAVNFQKVIKGILPLPNNQGIADEVIDYPNLVNVPYFILQGGGACIVMPIAKGDPCVILFCDRDMDIWLQTGQVAPPNSDRVHNINDAIALVGINNLVNPLQDFLNGMLYMNCWWTQTSGNFTAGNGFDGTFTTGDGRVATVSGGIIISVQ